MSTIREDIEEILVECFDDYEQMCAWECAFTDEVETPFHATLLGVSVEVQGFQLSDDNTLQCLVKREEQQRWIGIEDLDEEDLPEDCRRMVMLYRTWLGGDY